MQQCDLVASDGHTVAGYAWDIGNPRAMVQIAHGMGEHARRYDAVAKALNQAGFAVFATDHRGHGGTGRTTLGYMGGDGWNRTLADTFEFNRMLRSRHPEVPLVLLGHSMGSMLGQQYITRYGYSIDAIALSGSPGFKNRFGRLIPGLLARFEAWRHGPDRSSALLQKMLFGGSNKAFDGPGATGFEWLSRDPAEVKKYVDDPECGFVLTTGSLVDLFAGAAMTQSPACLAKIPTTLPVYVFAGADDPVHGGQQDINRMLDAYRSCRLSRLEHRWYPGGRHEMFNETNRDEVIADLVQWLHRVTS